jgi:adenylate cyclase
MKQFLKFLLILLSSLGVAGGGYAQKQGQAAIDSMLQALPKQKEDTSKANLLTALSFTYQTINPDEGIKYGRQALELTTKLQWEKGIGNANNRLGNNYYGKSDYLKAIEYYQEALKIFEEIGYKKGIASVTGNMGNIYNEQSDYPKALEYYFKALKMDEELENKNSIAAVTECIGNVYCDQGDNPKALEYDFKALKMEEEVGNKSEIANVTGNIGCVYYSQSDYPKALEYDFKALKMHEDVGNKSGIANVTGNIGSIYNSEKNYTMAIAYEQKALKIDEEIGDKHNAAWQLAFMGNALLSLVIDTPGKSGMAYSGEMPEGKYVPAGKAGKADVAIPAGKAARLRKAIDYLRQGLAISKEINAPDVMQLCYEGFTKAYKLSGDYKKAMEYADDEKVINDSVFSLDNRNKMVKLEKAREQYGDSLKAVAEKRAMDIKAQHRRNYEYIGAGVLVLLLGFTFVLIRNNKLLGKEKKRSDNLLLNILPEEVADQLKDTGKSAARQFDDVTVLFTDFVNFTEAGERMKPQELIDELHTCFKKFDEITGKYNVEKIKTIGDAYLAVAGLPTADPLHAEHVVRAAIEINTFIEDRVAKLGNRTFEIRIGIHSGSVVAGIVGVKKFAYDIWGDTVNTAARMEQNSEAGRINISQTTYELVKDKIHCEYRGEIEAKGKGMLKMYYVA